MKPTIEEMQDLANDAMEMVDEGRNPYFGMTYQQGVADALNWVTGFSEKPDIGYGATADGE